MVAEKNDIEVQGNRIGAAPSQLLPMMPLRAAIPSWRSMSFVTPEICSVGLSIATCSSSPSPAPSAQDSLSAGQVLSLAGPVSMFLAYLITGFNLYCVINSLGEMAALLPIPGCVPIFATRYVDESLLDSWLELLIHGEAEFFFGAIKLTIIVGLILLMLIITCGGDPSGHAIGFAHWMDPGTMNAEMVVAAGETENSRRNIPKAVRRVFWRILIFDVIALFHVGLCVSSDDKGLLNAISSDAPGANQNPFVIAIETAGIKTMPGILNGIILSSTWSAGNSFSYASRVSSTRPPSTARHAILRVCYTYLCFYKGLRYHAIDRNTLPYKALFQPYLACFAICFCLTIALFPGRFSAKSFIPPHINIPIVLTFFFSYKLIKKTKLVKVQNMDVWSGKAEIDRMEPV
ncbi:putative proline-specific permease put4 [Emericellopsis cladophorae]|uniref:Proline-specific permease put4 n=1 Tax=Emericellopsis cladophorae TaxID=2686198 RepID=A0A9Q0BGK6_9HYPO|nr:putative proline-specific permease put4 [Emericellopsis cladophorae]KAI6784597.1 putative proline-specific permease put4 [Emericellopsis cladophorae]